MSDPVQVMRRLFASLEAGAAEEAGLAGHGDWAGLARLGDRELVLVQRLAEERARAGADPAGAAGLAERVAAVQARFARLQARLAESRTRLEARLGAVRQASARARAVGGAYRRRAA